MNKKNGFTLIELLGVISILAIISLIAIPSVTNLIIKNKEKEYNIQLNSIKDSLAAYASKNSLSIPNNKTIYLSLYQLANEGFIDMSVANPKTGDSFPIDMVLTIKNTSEGFEYNVLTATGANIYSKSQLEKIGSLKLKKDYLSSIDTSNLKGYIKEAKNNGTDYTSSVTITEHTDYYEYTMNDTSTGLVSTALLSKVK